MQSDTLLENYDINEITDFMKILLSDLSLAYETGNLAQKKVLIGSIFPSGVTWNYPGYSNRDYSPLYRAIYQFKMVGIALGDPNMYLFEPAIKEFGNLLHNYTLASDEKEEQK